VLGVFGARNLTPHTQPSPTRGAIATQAAIAQIRGYRADPRGHPRACRTVRPGLESGPRAPSSWLARARRIRGTCPLPLKAASFRT